jgi:transcriptional regulator with XRE-family HTH domain
MGRQASVGDQLRQRIQSERERRGLSQADVADYLTRKGIPCYRTTITKIEAGMRDARVDEISAIADMFGISLDALTGRTPRDTDLLWAVSKLTGNAQKMSTEVSALRLRFIADAEDVRAIADDFHAADLLAYSHTVAAKLSEAGGALTRLANMFPLPAAAKS